MIGITFGYKHSYDDFGLILTEVSIGLPEPRRYTVDIPGKNGLLDMTEAITPVIRYKHRPIKFTFEMKGDKYEWDEALSEISGYLHGQRLQVIQDTDPDYYWDAFCKVDSFSAKKRLGKFVVSCDCYPFKLKLDETVKSITRSGTLNCPNGRMSTTPVVTTTAPATLSFGGETVTVAAGTRRIIEFQFTEGDNIVTVNSTGTTTFTYREGAL